jgi:exodeoxyribonuclease VII large subunit
VRADLLAELASLNARQSRSVARYFDERRTRLRSAARALPKPDEFLALVRQRFDTVVARLPQALRANVQHHRVDLAKVSGGLSLRPIVQKQEDLKRRLFDATLRKNRAISRVLQTFKDRLSSEAKLFAALNYTSVLARGFAIVLDSNGQPIKLAAAVSPGQALKIQFADDKLDVTARKKTSQGELF